MHPNIVITCKSKREFEVIYPVYCKASSEAGFYDLLIRIGECAYSLPHASTQVRWCSQYIFDMTYKSAIGCVCYDTSRAIWLSGRPPRQQYLWHSDISTPDEERYLATKWGWVEGKSICSMLQQRHVDQASCTPIGKIQGYTVACKSPG